MPSSFDRRSFLRTVGGLALTSSLAPSQSLKAARRLIVPPERTPRVLVLAEQDFPATDDLATTRKDLEKAFGDWSVKFVPVAQVGVELGTDRIDLLVLPYGSSVPLEAWEAILRYLQNGGSWLNLGGRPFAVPVTRVGAAWTQGQYDPNLHKRLGITQTFAVDPRRIARYVGNDLVPLADEIGRELKITKVHELYVRFTTTIDFPSESGTSGAQDASLRTVVEGLSRAGRPLAAPIVLVDRMQGEFAGGRWVFAACEGNITPKGIRLLAELALEDSVELTVNTPLACYYPGEQPLLNVRLRRPRGTVESFVDGPCQLTVTDESGRRRAELSVRLTGTGTIATSALQQALKTAEPLKPGLYTIEASLPVRFPGAPGKLVAKAVGGFWVYDEALMKSGKPLTVGADLLVRDGKPFPVAGTTYMASDVHRKFLVEPNPALWDRDMRAMHDAGINIIRTGIWTGWRSLVPDAGNVNEGALRALDAFLLSAHRYDIPVVFTFFAFVPEMWGGKNPYLDPRSVAAQQEFLAIVAQRYRDVDDLVWDLINEPSFDSPSQLWSCRPNYDEFEALAWDQWLVERHSPDNPAALRRVLSERWRINPDDSLGVPSSKDFTNVNIFEERRPLKTLDFRLFAQEMFMRWIRAMSSALRSNGNTRQLITVGQDEAGTGDSPNPQFFASEVDFTCLHNWWLNGDLLWDTVMTTAPGLPNLVEETGVMFYEKMDSSPWRSEEEVRDLLERKMALSIGRGAAGFIEWIWNTNSYMALDNEVAIGFHRADGTAKPELEALLRFAAFFQKHGRHFVDAVADEVVMTIPHSQMFSVRNLATTATKLCVRVMHAGCRMTMCAVSEYTLSRLARVPRLVVVPSARVLTDGAWKAVCELAERGATVAMTGFIEGDEYWRVAERISSLGGEVSARPIARQERITIDGSVYGVPYSGELLERAEAGVIKDARGTSVSEFSLGSGRILWSPLPLELSSSDEPARAFYRMALRAAGCSPLFSLTPDEGAVLVRPSVYRDAILYTLVSEAGQDVSFELSDRLSGSTHALRLPAGRADLLLLDKTSGRAIGRLEDVSL